MDTPRANRLHIALFGRRNVGKSSIVNALTNQELSLVSDTKGTTTDPVLKSMELLPLGPVVIVDTAGLDDEGTLGELRIGKTYEVMDKTDIALLIFSGENLDFSLEKSWLSHLSKRNIPVVGVINKIDSFDLKDKDLRCDFNIPFVSISAEKKLNIGELKEAIISNSPTDFEKQTIVGDILKPKDLVVVVAPQDIQAPKGRLILPQVQIIRDILDHDALALTIKDSQLVDLLKTLNRDPDLVITDSQIFKKINELIPSHIPLTSFSVLMAKYKGDLDMFLDGAKVMKLVEDGDKILIAEACTHHALKNDVAREKLPNWIRETTGKNVTFETTSGGTFPKDLTPYKLILHCGSCMFTRKELLSRLSRCKEQGVPITNFGVAIAELNGILDKVTYMPK